MNLLFMQNGLQPYGIPRNGLVALYDPYKDIYGRNILPVGSENFVTGWSQAGGAVVTVSDYVDTIEGISTVTCKRIQSTGGNSVEKYFSVVNNLSSQHQINSACYAKLLSGNAKAVSNGTGMSTTRALTSTFQHIEISVGFYAGLSNRLAFWVNNITDNLDIVVYQPQINIGSTLYPYSLPAGLPQSLTDYTGKGNNAQLGSAAGADTNDPAWNGNGLVFGADDYLKSSSPAFDDMQAFTCITVCKANSAGGGSTGRIFDKSKRLLAMSDNLIQFNQTYTGGTHIDKTAQGLTFGNNYIIGLSYQPVDGITQSKIMINASQATLTTTTTTGTISADTTNDLYIGNLYSAAKAWDGSLYIQLWYNRVLSDAEYMQAYNGLRRLMNSRGVVI